MISCWTIWIKNPYTGWQVWGQIDTADYGTRRSAERYAEDIASDIQATNELDYVPSTEVVPDLREA